MCNVLAWGWHLQGESMGWCKCLPIEHEASPAVPVGRQGRLQLRPHVMGVLIPDVQHADLPHLRQRCPT